MESFAAVSRVVVREKPVIGKYIAAAQSLAVGEVIVSCTPKRIVGSANMHTVQLDATRHAEVGNSLEFTAHHCAPNGRIEIDADDNVSLIALREIAPDEIVSFDYNCTEWDMESPFDCACGAVDCVGRVRGYKHLDPAARAKRAGATRAWLRAAAEGEGRE